MSSNLKAKCYEFAIGCLKLYALTQDIAINEHLSARSLVLLTPVYC